MAERVSVYFAIVKYYIIRLVLVKKKKKRKLHNINTKNNKKFNNRTDVLHMTGISGAEL